MQVQVTKLLGEGGYAFIYAAREQSTGKEYALKRFLVFEESKVQEVVQEVGKSLKSLSVLLQIPFTDSADQRTTGPRGLCDLCYSCQCGPQPRKESEQGVPSLDRTLLRRRSSPTASTGPGPTESSERLPGARLPRSLTERSPCALSTCHPQRHQAGEPVGFQQRGGEALRSWLGDHISAFPWTGLEHESKDCPGG